MLNDIIKIASNLSDSRVDPKRFHRRTRTIPPPSSSPLDFFSNSDLHRSGVIALLCFSCCRSVPGTTDRHRFGSMTFSFSLPSNSSSRRNPDDDENQEGSKKDGETTREYITEFDPSKIITDKQCKQLVIPPLQNTWTVHKKLKAPSNEDLPDHSVIPNSIETMMLQKLKDDLQNLPDDRGSDEFIDAPVEAFGAALLAGYGWSEGKGIGRNAKEDVKVVQYARWVGRQGLGFKPETNDTGGERSLNQRRLVTG